MYDVFIRSLKDISNDPGYCNKYPNLDFCSAITTKKSFVSKLSFDTTIQIISSNSKSIAFSACNIIITSLISTGDGRPFVTYQHNMNICIILFKCRFYTPTAISLFCTI